ncbi:MAG: threonine synthase [Deltaproteobacteria bacterium]|jgi:threonine synthase|nr:threonine synthase [Deltaproteobacteria bacterium]MBT6435205.1 threonine synthase [Deltaproteobacteria bacterium]
MSDPKAHFSCIECNTEHSLRDSVYSCSKCGNLLEVRQDSSIFTARSPEEWKTLFDGRLAGRPGYHGSGVWRFREWILPDLPEEDIVSLGEGASPLTTAPRLSEELGVELLTKQCGHTLSGSFKDLGMTVLVSQVNHLRKTGRDIPAVACASTGDTSAALAAYGAAAGIRTLVLLPSGKISAAQLIQPLAHGARVIAIETDFDGCMEHVQKLCVEQGVYLANSKNSLRIEGQKTVALEICQGLGWKIPDWVVIPGGNLGNVSALTRGFENLKSAGIIDKLPKVLVAQAEKANPLFHSFQKEFAPLEPIQAQATQASAIRIGNPVSFPKAITALKACNGRVASVAEQELTQAARIADERGLYLCPHTAVAVAGLQQGLSEGYIEKGAQVVVVSTAHGLKFTEFKTASATDTVPEANLGSKRTPLEVASVYSDVVEAALGA